MLNIKKSVVDEVIVKMIPDDVLIRVSFFDTCRFTFYLMLRMSIVYDTHYERAK